MVTLSWIIWVGLNAITIILIKGRQRKISHTQRRGPHVEGAELEDVGLEDWSDAATSQEMLAATRSWKRQGKVALPTASGRSMALLTPRFQPRDTDFRLLVSRTARAESL